MTNPAGGRRTIEVDADVYEVLASTATTRNTDVNGALRYLIEVPPVPAARTDNEDE
ncbi:hypothetical protein [Dactylosporangium sp. NPDC006015]|uniref:hypothetical protein n=1 Tax=Dactylosporangium sp. NPDC006015 TaxID=3154576 RepID=UPI0033B34F2B